METCENAMKTETNENGFQSGDFGKRIHLKTVAFPCKRLKTNTSVATTTVDVIEMDTDLLLLQSFTNTINQNISCVCVGVS